MQGVHFLAVEQAKEHLQNSEQEFKDAVLKLDEALKEGDLKENSDYDVAKAIVTRITKERDELTPIVSAPVVRANDGIKIIEEGSIIHLVVYNVTAEPLEVDSDGFESCKKLAPVFDGVLMFGATYSLQELLVDKALSAQTPVGSFILGKQSGDYSVPVPAGFANLTVEKLSSNLKLKDLDVSLNLTDYA